MTLWPNGATGRVAIVVAVLVALFAAWSFATLQIPPLAYGDPDRPIAGKGATLPIAAGSNGWTSTGGDPGGSQYNPLASISRTNVARLERDWVYHSGDATPGRPPEGSRSKQIPLVVGNTLYLCSPFHRVIAVDATTGVER